MRKRTINDDERRQWVLNDEGLYRLWQSERGGDIREWIRKNRALIDEVIRNVTEGKKSAHYLRYGR